MNSQGPEEFAVVSYVAARITAGLLVVAVLPLSYGYYPFLRYAVVAVAFWGVVTAVKLTKPGWAVAMAAILLLFNPVAPVHLTKGMWVPIDLVCAGVFWVSAHVLFQRVTAAKDNDHEAET